MAFSQVQMVAAEFLLSDEKAMRKQMPEFESNGDINRIITLMSTLNNKIVH